MYKEIYKEKIDANDGDKGTITYYDNGSVKVFWMIQPKNVYGTMYCYDCDLVKVSVRFIKPPKYLVTLETLIKPQHMQVKGIRQNISSYHVQIKQQYMMGKPGIATPYNRYEETKVNLCRHPSKNRSKHGAKTEVNRVYKAGTMRPK